MSLKLFGYEIGRIKAPRRTKSAYQAALVTRLTSDWPTAILSADAATRWNLPQLRARSRDLERNNGIQSRYLALLESNVIGSEGGTLQMKIRKGDGRTSSGMRTELDKPVNDLIESEWREFGKRGNYDITGTHSRQDFWRLTLRTTARDGDALQLMYRGANVPTKWKVAFQLLEGDYIDDLFNLERGSLTGGQPLPPGHTIRMGIERDAFKRKVAVWIFAKHPGDYGTLGVYMFDGRRLRIPIWPYEPAMPVHAFHIARTKRAEETRPVPWITPAMETIKLLDGYDIAELVASQTQASKHVYYQRDQFAPDGSPLDYATEDAATGKLLEEIEPGTATELPIGYKANFYNPTHPNTAYPDFTRSQRKRIASAVNMAYSILFSDVADANYSSQRGELLDEREHRRMDQAWLRDTLCAPSFEAFLQFQLMIGTLPGYGLLDYPRLNAAEHQFRGWDWIDPQKDANAASILIESKLTTRTKLLAEKGEDFEETIDELKHEEEYIKAAGLDPLVHEPKRSGQLIDSAELANAPGAESVMMDDSKSARAKAQARDGATGQFVKGNGAGALGDRALPAGEGGELITLQMPPVTVAPNITVERKRGKVTKQITMDDPKTGVTRTATVVEEEM